MDTVISLLADAVRRYDRHPALMIKPAFRTRTWRYRDLGEQVPRVARALVDLGLERGDRVVIWAVNRPEWAIGFLAATHAGLVGVPLDVRSAEDFAARHWVAGSGWPFRRSHLMPHYRRAARQRRVQLLRVLELGRVDEVHAHQVGNVA